MLNGYVDVALRKGVTEAYQHSSSPTEPELVAGVFATVLPALATTLQQKLPDARVSGVFCHSRPMATKVTDASWRCEVGDLLVVSRYDDGRAVQRSALLLQVKKPPLQFATSGTAARQVELYQHWPEVNVFGSARDVTNPPHRGAQFSFWNVCARAGSRCTSCRWDQRIPGTSVAADLADEVADVILCVSGRPFVDEAAAATARDDWSALIWDLLRQSINRAWSVAAGAQSAGSRTWDDGVFLSGADTGIPALLEGSEVADVARELWSSPATEWLGADPRAESVPPLNPELPREPARDDEGGLPVIIAELGPPMNPGTFQRS